MKEWYASLASTNKQKIFIFHLDAPWLKQQTYGTIGRRIPTQGNL
jgi:hypothetical protein